MPPIDELTATRAVLDEARRGADSLATRMALLETEQRFEGERRSRADSELARRLEGLEKAMESMAKTMGARHEELVKQLREVQPAAQFANRIAAEASTWLVRALVGALIVIATLAAVGMSPTDVVRRVIPGPAATGGP